MTSRRTAPWPTKERAFTPIPSRVQLSSPLRKEGATVSTVVLVEDGVRVCVDEPRGDYETRGVDDLGCARGVDIPHCDDAAVHDCDIGREALRTGPVIDVPSHEDDVIRVARIGATGEWNRGREEEVRQSTRAGPCAHKVSSIGTMGSTT
jgi:hypothetical protein